jgi:hypothetical protein
LGKIADYLGSIKQSVGSFETNRKEIKDFLLSRLEACDKDVKNDNLYYELYANYIKLSQMMLILSVFKQSEEEKQKINNICGLIRRHDRKESHGR